VRKGLIFAIDMSSAEPVRVLLNQAQNGSGKCHLLLWWMEYQICKREIQRG
jgi:hypothetical protein